MPRYADPHACPDCRAPLTARPPTTSGRCPSCGLTLTGPLPSELLATLTRADEILSVLRALSAPVPAPAAPRAWTPASFATPLAAHPAPLPSVEQLPSRPWRLPGASVPRILLGLGALCLLVAALVFLAVAWVAIGQAGRTLVVAMATVAAGGLAAWAVTRRLRAAAESLTALALGLVVLDVLGAEAAGWLDPLSSAGVVVLAGGSLLGLGGIAARVAAAYPRLVAAEVGEAVGLALVCASAPGLLGLTGAAAVLLALLLSAAATGAAARTGLTVLAWSGAGLTGLCWLALLAVGLADSLADPSLGSMVGEARAWPLLAAAVLLAAPCLAGRLAQTVRTAVLAGGTTLLVVTAGLPAVDEPLRVGTLVALAAVAVCAVVAAALPAVWARSLLAPAALAAVAVVGVVAAQVLGSAARLTAWTSDARSDVWTRPVGVLLPPRPEVPGWPLLILPSVALLMAAGVVLVRSAGHIDLPMDRTRALVRPLGPVVVLLLVVGVAATVAAYPVPVWTVLAVLLLGGAGVLAWGPTRITPVAGAALLGLAALVVGAPSRELSLVALAAALALVVATDLVGPGALRPAARLLLPFLAGPLVVDLGLLAGAGADERTLAVVVVLGLLVLVRPVAGYRIGSLVVAAVVVVTGTTDLVWLAVQLTVAGTCAAGAGLLHRRPELRRAGTFLLLAATWVRLGDLGVTTVEAYTLPLATLLLAAGLLRMRDGTDSPVALGPGLTLALVPSLLATLVDPVSTRALLLGLACTALVVTGGVLRRSAPLVAGAAVGLMLVLRQVGHGDVVPQWVVIGAVGVVLTVLGITWERRLHDLHQAAGYLRALR